MAEDLLRVTGLSKTFGSVKALQGVDLVLQVGSVHAVIGHNGAGKSTLMNLLSGVHVPSAGTIVLGGKPVRFASPRQALEQGLSMVHQELSIIPDLDVAENIFIGREPLTRFGSVDRTQLYGGTERILAEFDLPISSRARCADLSVGTRQMVEIARAVSSADCKVLILDEPTSALSEAEQERLYALIERLKARRIGILYISHKLDEVRALSDTLTVMRDGRQVATVPTASVTHEQMVEMMVGHVVASGAAAAPAGAAPGLEIIGLSSTDRKVRDVTFSARRGEIVGLAGMLGSGRSEVFETLFGLRRIDKGSVRIHGQELRIGSSTDAMRAGVALVPEDRRNQGIFAGLPVWKNAVLATCGDLFGTTLGIVRRGQAQAATEREVERFAIRTSSIGKEIQLLSGGNQQKVILARWLLRSPKVLLLDDPTAGIDVGAKGEIHTLVRSLAAEGLTVVVSSSEFPELLDLCHRILVIREGTIVDEMDPRTCTEGQLVHAASVKAAA